MTYDLSIVLPKAEALGRQRLANDWENAEALGRQRLANDWENVVGSDGKIIKMPCYCGAADCRKRLY
ncbi:hypothetical protein COCNU_scaffold021839G000010 [Cocos nucifera]|nr:hypothetical protein [Cocos nucifera]